mgnify:CR=1 FL=1|jgi:hypothetical protein
MNIPEYKKVGGKYLDKFGIENFYSTAAANDFARTNLFRVIRLGDNRFEDGELLYVESTTLPGRSITNIQVPFMGLVFNVPGTATYNNSGAFNITFRVPQGLSVRRKFEQWTRDVFNDIDSSGDYNIPSTSVKNQMVMVLIDKKGEALRTYTFYGVYCQSVGDVNLDITTAGEIMKQQATLAYQYWRLSPNSN